VLANRRAMARILPEVFTGQAIGTVSDCPTRLAAALRAPAPSGVADPKVVVLTPGIRCSSARTRSSVVRAS